MRTQSLRIRRARPGDRDRLMTLQRESVTQLCRRSYSPGQLDGFLNLVGTFDGQLILDGTYYVVEENCRLVGCGGWSRRARLIGSRSPGRRAPPAKSPGTGGTATIRAIYTRPACAGRGVGRAVMAHAEAAALAAGYRRLQLAASLTAVGFYRALGYRRLAVRTFVLPDGTPMPVVAMIKTFCDDRAAVAA